MNEPPHQPTDRLRNRLGRLGSQLRKVVPFGSGVFAALAALLLYNLLVSRPQSMSPQEVSDTVSQVLASATPPPAFSARVYQAIQPSLVLIQSETEGPDSAIENSLGSGVVITDQSDILTSLHVVEGASDILLLFADGTQSSGEIVATQPENDIAVLRPAQPPPLLVPAVLGNPNAMSVGDEAFAVGNPFGLYSSMSVGVISGFNRTFQAVGSDQKLEGLIQIDAAVNPGNSGGPLLNRDGQVVGIVVGILNPTEDDVFIGIGFAVPISIAASAAGSPPY